MAYLDLSATSFTATIPTSPARPRAIAVRLSAAERDVIMLGVRDPLSSIEPITRRAMWSERIFGLRRVNSLADPRLEALRRFAVRLSRSRNADVERQALSHAGLPDDQINEAAALVRRLAPLKASRMNDMFGVVTATLLAFVAYAWVKSRVGDSVIAAIIVVVLGLPLVVTVQPRKRHSAGQAR